MQKINSSTSLMSSPSSGPVSTSAFLPPALCRFSTVFSQLSRLTSFLFLGLLIVPSAQTQHPQEVSFQLCKWSTCKIKTKNLQTRGLCSIGALQNFPTITLSNKRFGNTLGILHKWYVTNSAKEQQRNWALRVQINTFGTTSNSHYVAFRLSRRVFPIVW